MFKRLAILSVSVAALAGFGFGFAAVFAEDQLPPVDFAAVPVFPSDAPKAAKPQIVQPRHATNRIAAGKSFRFLACRESRDVRGTQERRCLSWNPKKGWAKSAKWVPAYQLLSLTGPLPAAN